MLTSQEIRQRYNDYFVRNHAHTFVPSSPVVPHNDPTLMFANAGMNQFKDVFLGTGTREYSRAVNTQKCIRAGGKHNDLEDVGRDTYHHTFFEMLGNWSFGDYFKKESIVWAWELLTVEFGIDKTRLHATVFGGDPAEGLAPDEEAAQLWRELTDINPANIHYGSKKDNFWEMGDTGPCGPCSEIHIDRTPDRSGHSLVNGDDARVMEIWNLVFIQFNRETSGNLTPLPAKHVDTGMGFERLCAVLQGKDSNYDTDVFTPIFKAIQEVTQTRPYGGKLDDPIDMAYRVIADHIRCLTFAITDGAPPSNDGRGYVLRRILRRAVRHGWQTLGVKEPFLCRLAPTVVETMGDAFPELRKNPGRVVEILREEEESFGRTLDRGIALFDEAATRAGGVRISAQDAFKLHDTYGFPLDLTQVMAEERGMAVDTAGFDILMEQARELARSAGGHKVSGQVLIELVQKQSPPATKFRGYEVTELDAKTPCMFYAVTEAGYSVLDRAEAGQTVVLVAGETPFYAESGGQVGDVGVIRCGNATFRVEDTQKVGEVFFHLGQVESGVFEAGANQSLRFEVDSARRARIMSNHTSTHMLNRALRKHVNPEADQKGSLVDDEKLRFDFSHNAAVTPQQIDQVERTVNTDIASDLPVYTEYAPLEKGQAISSLRAVFGEKYPPKVRIVSVGVPVADLLNDPENAAWRDYSVEFCGGTHMAKTGDAEGLIVVSEEAVAKGVRRLTALTGRAAHQATAQGEMLLSRAQAMKAAPADSLAAAVAELTQAMNGTTLPMLTRIKLRDAITELQKTLKEQDKQRSREASGNIVETARQIADAVEGDLIVQQVEGATGKTLRDALDVIRKKKPEAAVLLAAVEEDKVSLAASVPESWIKRGLKAGDWIRETAKIVGGSGGGRPDMAQAGGKDTAKVGEALAEARRIAESKD